MSATPRPWKVYGTTVIRDTGTVIEETVCNVEDINSFVQDEDHNKANAALIVRAVNNHDDLVEALSNLIRLFGGYQGLELTDAKAVLARAKL